MVLASSTRSAIVSILSLTPASTSFLTRCCLRLEIGREILHQGAVDLDEVERHVGSQ
jgi:hypothetical protein